MNPGMWLDASLQSGCHAGRRLAPRLFSRSHGEWDAEHVMAVLS
jgi:hypothetical protein